MKEQLIEFETAKLAKEKGFDIPCTKIYNTLGDLWDSHYSDMSNDDVDPGACCTSPTQSLLQKWLRENHDIIVEVRKGVIHKWYFLVFDKNDPIVIEDSFEYTYEQALEKGLIEALKLIKS